MIRRIRKMLLNLKFPVLLTDEVMVDAQGLWNTNCTAELRINGKSNVYEEFLAFERDNYMIETLVEADRAYSGNALYAFSIMWFFVAQGNVSKPVVDTDVQTYLEYNACRAEKLMYVCPVKEMVRSDKNCAKTSSFYNFDSIGVVQSENLVVGGSRSPVIFQRGVKRRHESGFLDAPGNYAEFLDVDECHNSVDDFMHQEGGNASVIDCYPIWPTNSQRKKCRESVDVDGSGHVGENRQIQTFVSPSICLPRFRRKVERVSRDLSMDFRRVAEDRKVRSNCVEDVSWINGSDSNLVDVDVIFSDCVLKVIEVSKMTNENKSAHVSLTNDYAIEVEVVDAADVMECRPAARRKRKRKKIVNNILRVPTHEAVSIYDNMFDESEYSYEDVNDPEYAW
ncbi:hypothetical protein RIF29_14796 [Crotalaria pallida]|uniref:Uncharacterized protein n=1 Tax=Crotalaria pallida TaxID=3830 RepID=A0AAN9FIT0_CROPI